MLGFYFHVLHINLTTIEDNGNVLTHSARVNIQTLELQSTITRTFSAVKMID
jgi:hypothetical protein